MPEYLAPDVYVEEIDTGSKPIEGVSTSTAGMVGVTERGPVDVPILVTSYGEYTRWFGERLNKADFLDHCYMPHAVEGFFTNGGKRLYVVRVLETAAAANAHTKLFDRNAAVSATTRLLANAGASASAIYVVSTTGLTAAPPTWIRIGDGSGAEYRTIVTPGVPPLEDNEVALRLPLAFAYNEVDAKIDHFTLTPLAGAPTLLAAAAPGDTIVHVSGGTPISVGNIIQLGAAASGDEEFGIVAVVTPAGANFDLTLKAPVILSHPNGEGVELSTAAAAAGDQTTLASPVAQGGSVLFLKKPVPYTSGQFLQIADAAHTEIRRVGQLAIVPLAVPAYGNYPTGAIVESVAFTEDPTMKNLAADTTDGATVIDLTNRTDLAVGDVLAIDPAGTPQREYIIIKDLPNPQPPPNAGKVILAAPLHGARKAQSELHRINGITGVNLTAKGASGVAVDAPKNSTELVISSAANAMNEIVRITVANGVYFHSLSGNAAVASAGPLAVDHPLDLAHVAGETVVAVTPLLTVEALDAGSWANRLRVAAHDNDPPLVKTKIRAILDGTHLRLDSANGVEPGTILSRVDAAGTVLESVKVQRIDRQNDFIITLDAAVALSGAAAVGDAVRSQEFQLDVFLMRQPDPAVPTRADAVLTGESFSYLSLDPRHSRYVHKVIGTTWAPGALADDDGHPLRKSDERSEGTSWLVRVRDEESEPAAQLAIRMGPEALTDTLPSGAKRPARLRLFGGDDAVGAISNATYLGVPNIEPELRTGLHSLENKEDISIVACPGRTGAQLQGSLIEHCENMRFRFAVLDGPEPPNDSLNDAQTQRQQFDSKYAALYHPWLVIPEPFPVNLSKIADYPIPPSGHMLGIYARTDIERGVHKAPANEVVRGITGLQRLLNKSEHDILNPYPVNINVIRDFRNDSRGIRVYGGRVITSDPDWKYVNVRRLLIFIEASINRGLQWVVFEPNAEPLWARVRRSITNFLTLVWRNGALEGTKVEEAFFVKCDRTTMTQIDIDSGRLICIVGVAPVKPAEFVIVRIGLWTAHADD
jgi:uncharacterized protein